MDRYDRALLKAIQADSDRTLNELAEEIGTGTTVDSAASEIIVGQNVSTFTVTLEYVRIDKDFLDEPRAPEDA